MSTTPPARPAAGRAGEGYDVASWLRRILALMVDWIASTLVTVLIVGSHAYMHDSGANWVPLGVFWLESTIGTAIAGGSFGQLLTGIRVLRRDGGTLSLLRALARQALVCLVVPPVVFRPDGRGLHDLWTDSAPYAWPLRPATGAPGR